GYARERQPEFEVLDLAECARRIIADSEARDLVDASGLAPAEVFGDALGLGLVVHNLLENAAAAVAGQPGAAVTVSVARAAGRVRLTVADNGPPLGDEAFARLAEPVLSGKEGGLGLGLSICRGIARRHNGALAFERGPQGRGLAAILELPDAERL
ncbi:MAG: ATP-binding protein, partial [Duodenibacillus sp.]|nr:ATP-binding protein [Duodenibacillus sp.]